MKLEGARVLVTGGAGFLGRHVVAELRRAGVSSVRVLDDLSSWAGDGAIPLWDYPPDDHAIADVRSQDAAERAVRDCDLVVHLACRCVRLSWSLPVDVGEVNAAGTLCAALAAYAAGVARFVYVSSSEVYGSGVLDPMAESHPCLPTTVYGASKLAGEHLARAVMGDRCVVVRPFNAVGDGCHIEGSAGEVVPRWIARALRGEPLPIHGDGHQSRDFTYAGDLARGIVLAAGCDDLAGAGPVNLCSGRATTMIELAAAVRRTLGIGVDQQVTTEARPGDLRRQRGSHARATTLLGWEPTTPRDEALRRCIGWVRRRVAGGRVDVPDEPWRA